MKLLRIVLAAVLFAVSGLASAAGPFVVVDVPSAAADRCLIANPSTAPAVEYTVAVDAAYGNPANGNRICKLDVASAAVGDTTITVQLKSDLWGVMGSPVPFSFTRPSPGSLAPAGIALKK